MEIKEMTCENLYYKTFVTYCGLLKYIIYSSSSLEKIFKDELQLKMYNSAIIEHHLVFLVFHRQEKSISKIKSVVFKAANSLSNEQKMESLKCAFDFQEKIK
jgi:hypothetical protein